MFAIASDDHPVVLWDFLDPQGEESQKALALFRKAIDEDALITAHNYGFELAITTYCLTRDTGIERTPRLENWRCTQAMCRRAAIPESLSDATAFLNVPQQKASYGRKLMELLSMQDREKTLMPPPGLIDPETVLPLKRGGFTKGKKPKNRKTTSPVMEEEILWDWMVKVGGEDMTVRAAWELYKEYCRQDVRAEMDLHKALSHVELTGDELASFQFDMRMNHRGAPFNVVALENTYSVVRAYQEKLEARMLRMCGLTSTQREKLQDWLIARGYPEDNLQADTVEEVISNRLHLLTPLAQEVLKHRALLSFAAIAKIPVMLGSACPDGRIRGTKTWHGARTGRGTSKLVQMDNMKKATIKDSQLAYALLCVGVDLATLEDLWPSPLEAIASCCRHFVQLPLPEKILDADYVGVEARIAPWLCGQSDKLQSILDGVDQYKLMAAEVVYNIPYEQVTREQRTVGKPVELQLGYGAGGRGLRNSLRDNHGVHLPLKQCNEIVAKFRARFPKYKDCWDEMEQAALAAIRHGTTSRISNGKIAFGRMRKAGITYLVMQLPSGRRMYYPDPKVTKEFKKYDEEDMEADPWKREQGGYWTDSISFYGQNQRVWKRIHTWGSRLFENACQAIGADLLNYGMICAENAGYGIFMCIHDQALAESNGGTLEGYIEALCQKQPWAEDFPLEADGKWVPFYLKDD
jgi:DNA polymerase